MKIETPMTVDAIYAVMDEGERIHMVNKLHKHGYTGSHDRDGNLTPRAIDAIVEDAGHFMVVRSLRRKGHSLSEIVLAFEAAGRANFTPK